MSIASCPPVNQNNTGVVFASGMLLMCLPQEVVHEIDAWSPIMPPPTWGSAIGV